MSEGKFKEIALDLYGYHDWLNHQAKKVDEEAKSRFVTISREFGCDGYPTATALQELIKSKTKETPWQIFTHPIINDLISDEKLGPEAVDHVSETGYSFTDWFMDGIVPDFLQSPQQDVFKRMKSFILGLAKKGNCIMVGAGAQIITHRLKKSKFQGINIRLVGSYEYRVKEVMAKFEINRGESEKLLKEKQHTRDKFIKEFTGQDAGDPSLYHLIINNEQNSPEMAAAVIFDYMKMSGMIKG